MPLLFVPAALAAGFLAPERHLLVFVLATLAIIPLAVDIGRATQALAETFAGVVIVALVGNAAEHDSAVTMARRDQRDATLAIAVGSSTQIALFVVPVLVLSSFFIAPAPLDLLFTPFGWKAHGGWRSTRFWYSASSSFPPESRRMVPPP